MNTFEAYGVRLLAVSDQAAARARDLPDSISSQLLALGALTNAEALRARIAGHNEIADAARRTAQLVLEALHLLAGE